MEIIAAASGVALGAAALAAIELHDRRRERPLVRRGLGFPGEVTTEMVTAVLGSVSGLPRGSRVVFDLIASDDEIAYAVGSEPQTLEMFVPPARAMLPGLRVMPADSLPVRTAGVKVSFTTSDALLRNDSPDVATAALLGALLPLVDGEALVLRWVLAPTRTPRLAELPNAAERRRHAGRLLPRLGGARPVGPDEHRELRGKYAGPLLRCHLAIGVAARTQGRERELAGRVLGVLRARHGRRGRLHASVLGAGHLDDVVRGRGGVILSPAEVVPLLGWPIGTPRVPGLSVGTGPLLMPDRRIPERGRVIGTGTWPGAERPIAQPVRGALSHTLVVGPTGSGKSVLLANLMAADLRDGRGFVLLDGKGDLADDVLRLVPERRDDVLVIDPADHGPVPGLRVFGHGEPELAADLLLGVFRDLFADAWGPRSEQWLRAGLTTLAHAPDATLADLPFLFTDDAYRRRLVGSLTDPMLHGLWGSFEAMGVSERAQQLAAPLNKLDQLVGRRQVRAVLGQPRPAVDLHAALREGRVVVVSLTPGRIGAPAARLIGAITVYSLFTAVQGRAALPAGARTPYFAYIDEPRVLGDLPVPVDALFELSRGFGVGMTVAAQSLSQLPVSVQRAAIQNAATLVVFRQSADDARLLARELAGVTAEELQHLDRFEVVARIGLGPGEIARPVTARTLPPPTPVSDAREVRRRSAERFGADPAAVDAALWERHQHSRPGEAIGRIRRRS